ncbi:hypothetical protein KR018_007882, partial [Drosophila ironensis]
FLKKLSNDMEMSKVEDFEAAKRKQERLEQEKLYFELYGRLEVHEWLLKDSVRSRAYRMAITGNELFRNSTVLDVGCGTGMLSMFAASAGAGRVIAVDGASIVEHTRKIVQDNQYDPVITVIQGKLEDLDLSQDIDKVDVILCDWMGPCLFGGNMLNTLIFARDKWLKPGGSLFPDNAHLYMAAIEGGTHFQEMDFWSRVHGLDLGVIGRLWGMRASQEYVAPERVVSEVWLLKSLDLYTARTQDATICCPFELKVTRTARVSGLVAYFDVDFTKTPQGVGFSTSPMASWTHWIQTVFHLDYPVDVRIGETIKGVFCMQPNPKNSFELQFQICVRDRKQSFTLSNSLTFG